YVYSHTIQVRCIFLFFFFSSRRRHTRLVSDWSSDVCSSDLQGVKTKSWADYPILRFTEVPAVEVELIQRLNERSLGVGETAQGRSEERRVGKEGGSRWERDEENRQDRMSA